MTRTLFHLLDEEWAHTARTRSARSAWRRWQDTDPALAACPVDLHDYPTWRCDADLADSDATLTALLATGSPLAQRAALQSLQPCLRAAISCISHLDREEAAQVLTAAAFTRLTAPGPAYNVARTLVLSTVRDTRRALARITPRPNSDHVDHAPADHHEAPTSPSASDTVLEVLADAVLDGELTVQDAALIAHHRISDTPSSALGAQLGIGTHSVNKRRRRAEAALLRRQHESQSASD